jgi:hypothetical protein
MIDNSPELKGSNMIRSEMRRCHSEVSELKRIVDQIDYALMDTDIRFY